MKQVFCLLILLTANLLQAQTPRLVVPVGHTDPIRAAMFPPGNWGVLTLGYDRRAIMWDLEGRPRIFFGDSLGLITACTFINSGYLMVQDQAMILYSWEGVEVKEIGRGVPYASITSLTSSSIDPSKFLSGHQDGTGRLWNSDGDLLGTLKSNSTSQPITSAVFFPDESIMLCYENGEASLWDKTGNLTGTFKSNEKVISAEMSQDGKTVLTSSLEGTAVLWDVQSGKQIETSPGTIRARISPDGRRILNDSTDQNLFEFFIKNGAGTRVNDNGEYVQNKELSSLVFSSDGKMAITVGYWKMYAKIWDLSSRKVIATLMAHSPVNRIAQFTPDGRNIVIACDSSIKRWTLFKPGLENFKLTDFELSVPGKLSMDCTKAISTSLNQTMALWDIQSGKKIAVYPSHQNPFLYDLPCEISPDGKFIAVKGKELLLYDTLGNLLQRLNGDNRYIESVAFTPDNQHILTLDQYGIARLWGLNGSVLWKDTILSRSRSIRFLPIAVHDSLIESYNIPIRDANNNILRSYNAFFVSDGITPDGNKFLILDSNGASLYDLSGKELRRFDDWRIEAAAFSPRCENDPGGGKFLLTPQNRSTKIWDTPSGKELATLIAIDSTDWVVTTPSGLFDASDGAMNLMYYMVNYEGENIVLGLEQLKGRYWQPGLLGSILGLSPYPVKNVGVFDNLKLFPSIEDNTRIKSDHLYIKLRERNGGIGKLSLIINGRRLEENLDPNRKKDLNIDLKLYSRHLRTDTLNTIELEVYESKDYLKSEPYKLYYQAAVKKRGEGTEEEESMANTCDAPRNLYLIVVGTSLYPQGVDSLPSANEDAVEMARVLSETGKLLYDDRVHLKLLSTKGGESPSKANIAAAFKAYQDSANVCDVLVVFFAGHGSNWGKDGDKSNFYYLTQDITFGKLNDDGIRKAYAISDQELTEWMTKIPAQNQLLILDACNSGQAAINMGGIVARDLDPDKIVAFNLMSGNTGSYVISGSSASGASFESAVFGHGLLTYSLLEGISGTALEGSKVDVLPLLLKSYKRVGELAQSLGEEQTPIIAKPRGNASFFVGKNDGSVKIELLETKPMVIRSILFDQVNYSDGLDLTEAVNKAFRSKEVKGKQAPWFYADISKNPLGFSIRGVYAMNQDGTVTVRGSLLKGETPVGLPFVVTGAKDAKVLADLILNVAKSGIKVK